MKEKVALYAIFFPLSNQELIEPLVYVMMRKLETIPILLRVT